MVELCSVATPELKCMFSMVNRIKYTPIADIVDYFKNVHKILGPIECTSMVTRISVSMLYGRKAIRFPNPALRLYSCESLTLQFDRMGEARHSFAGPPRTHKRARMEAAQQTMTTPQAHPQEP
jgi:hypothetical protein